MARIKHRKHRFSAPGTSPGLSLQHPEPDQPASLYLVDYTDKELDEVVAPGEQRWRAPIAPGVTRWIDIRGKPGPGLLSALANTYGLHMLALEDVINTGQRAKFEIFDDWFFIVMNRPVMDGHGVTLEQVNIFLGDTCVISIHESEEELLEPIRHRLRNGGGGRIRNLGADYLCYALLDLVVDLGFPVVNQTADTLIDLEEQLLADDPDPRQLEAVHQVKRNMISLRRGLMPQREVINLLIRDENPLMEERTRVYLRDCYDHMVHILELLDSYRDMASGLHDLYLSTLSQKMNEVMKVLTIIATIFIPLSFVVGLYGMNFNTELSPWNMPELNTRYGYPVLWLALLGVAGGMLVYFKRKHWF
jgi:magnesium transporter